MNEDHAVQYGAIFPPPAHRSLSARLLRPQARHRGIPALSGTALLLPLRRLTPQAQRLDQMAAHEPLERIEQLADRSLDPGELLVAVPPDARTTCTSAPP
jgi:hypothetical protein